MTEDNLSLWNAVEKTPPAETKPITGKPYKGTSPKPYWIVKRATETFGPCGIGWGVEIISERVENGALLAEGFYERVHIAHIRVWFKWNGEKGSIEHVGQTMFSGKRSSGQPYTDEDAPKKSVTDALVKALSYAGFAGDIFMGRYDDSKYVAELEREAAKNAGPDPLETYAKQIFNQVATAAEGELETMWRATMTELKRLGVTDQSHPTFLALKDAFVARRGALNQKEAA